MASIQILKSGLYPFSASQSYSRRTERLICYDGRKIIKFKSKLLINRRFMVSYKVEDTDDNESKDNEFMVVKNLQIHCLRHGMTPTSLLEENRSTSKDENFVYKEEDSKLLL
ncbi:hypothetical protein L2E82_18400 [Cichorium intybus]|uniref:Uncharacterized protein n=1 Tax=Cichorium intybus TaxID=13427 RepID=A0ACB9FAX0_CICIN|nr:hypothetical protein L2E82_18400 [Cichorium intybus]